MEYVISFHTIKPAILCVVAAVWLVGSTNVRASVIYASNPRNGTISEVGPDGTVRTYASGLNQPTGLVIDQSGNLFVSTAGSISKVAPDGVISTFVAGADFGGALALNKSGRLYATSGPHGDTINVISENGSVSTFATGLSYANSMTFDHEGNLYVGEPNSIVRITPAGASNTFTTQVNTGGDGLAFDRSGNLFSSTGETQIWKIDMNGLSSIFTSNVASSAGLAFDSNGDLFVANAYDYTISRVTPAGDVSTYAYGLYNPTGLAIQTPEPSTRWLAFASAAVLLLRVPRRIC